MPEPEPQSAPAKKWIVFLVFAAAVAAAVWLYMYRLGTYHFAEVEKGVLYRDGNRGLREFKTALRKSTARTVVMLNDDQELQKEPFKSELNYLNDQKIELIRIPVKLGGYPTSDQVRQFLTIVNDHTKRPILVHCAQGVRRTGMMVAAYQESVLGYDDAKTKACILPWGRKPTSQTLADVKAFIDGYDGKKRELTTMPAHVGGE
ncbi:MAG TPA: tyrosine-protein phosphatase [Tepidisphaeraceae bacterium]|nr:tyrosine-protein phosphatase [Tepidisphaeraceae bacterium]